MGRNYYLGVCYYVYSRNATNRFLQGDMIISLEKINISHYFKMVSNRHHYHRHHRSMAMNYFIMSNFSFIINNPALIGYVM